VVVQRAGLVPTILGMGAIYLLVTLGMFFNRSLRQMDACEPRPDTLPVVESPRPMPLICASLLQARSTPR
jgi:hypothetical protein